MLQKVKVKFLKNNAQVEVPTGMKLTDIVEEFASDGLDFGCKMGSCGTCRCLIAEGMENVNPLTEAEADLFETLTVVHSNERLGCQVVVNGDVTIQA